MLRSEHACLVHFLGEDIGDVDEDDLMAVEFVIPTPEPEPLKQKLSGSAILDKLRSEGLFSTPSGPGEGPEIE